MKAEQSSTETSPERAGVPTITPLPEDPTIGQLRRAISERDAVIKYKEEIIRVLQATQQFSQPSFDLEALKNEQKDEVIKALTKLGLQLQAAKLPSALFPTTRSTLKFADGRFEGDLICGKPHGKGSAWFDNGGKYEGEWVGGKKHGVGIFRWPSGASYQGEWKEGKRHGNGIYLALGGIEYQGHYKDDKKQGLGLVRLPNGNTQLAMHEGGRLEGLCVELSVDHQFAWVKHFKEDKPQGEWRKYELIEERIIEAAECVEPAN